MNFVQHIYRPVVRLFESGCQAQIIIIHLLGLAPAVYMTTPDNGPEGRMPGGASQCDGCRAVPLNLLNRMWKENLWTLASEEKDYDSGFSTREDT
jgi:hypothetical protein